MRQDPEAVDLETPEISRDQMKNWNQTDSSPNPQFNDYRSPLTSLRNRSRKLIVAPDEPSGPLEQTNNPVEEDLDNVSNHSGFQKFQRNISAALVGKESGHPVEKRFPGFRQKV